MLRCVMPGVYSCGGYLVSQLSRLRHPCGHAGLVLVDTSIRVKRRFRIPCPYMDPFFTSSGIHAEVGNARGCMRMRLFVTLN